MIASSFIRAMLRSRCVFSITLAASATLMLDARMHARRDRRCRTAAATASSVSRRVAGDDLDDLGQRVLLVARIDALRASSRRRSRCFHFMPERARGSGMQTSSVAPG